MDITYRTNERKFNYRACTIMLDNGRILAMRDELSPYYYLPGGRVKFGETAEDAVIREVREELGIGAEIMRPLWLNQAFFTEDVDGLRYHELCIYFLMDISKTDLLARGDRFTRTEGRHTYRFEWLDFARLKDEYFYPIFLKTEVYHLPQTFTLRCEVE